MTSDRPSAPDAGQESEANRGNDRLPIQKLFTVRCQDWNQAERLATTNISLGGMFLLTEQPTSVGARVTLAIQLPEGQKLELVATVRHVVTKELASARGKQPGIGVQVDEASRRDLILLLEQAKAEAASGAESETPTQEPAPAKRRPPPPPLPSVDLPAPKRPIEPEAKKVAPPPPPPDDAEPEPAAPPKPRSPSSFSYSMSSSVEAATKIPGAILEKTVLPPGLVGPPPTPEPKLPSMDIAFDDPVDVEPSASGNEATEKAELDKGPQPGPLQRLKSTSKPARERPKLPPKGDVVIGIDLGTTYSCAAILMNGKAQVIPSRKGTNTLPSVVAFAGDRTLIGDSAVRQLATNPKHTIVGAKRLVGRPFASPMVQQVREHFAYDIVEGEDGEAAILVGERVVSLEEVSALILKEIRESASLVLHGRLNRAVITCPAYYNERQRESVRAAGELAGFHVERILSEPTAAALNYGMGRALSGHRVLVYDLGGGTFDASLLEINGDEFKVLATGGDTFLGGIDFDACVAGLVVEALLEKEGIDAREDDMAIARILQFAEQAKRELSERKSTTLTIDHLVVRPNAARSVSIEITRAQVEALFEPLVEQTLELTKDVIARGGLKMAQVDDVILVGGQTRTPLVRNRLRELFGQEPKRSVHPDEAVAIGAAQYAASLASSSSVVLVDALPMSIGVGLPGGRFKKIIERDTALPVVRGYQLQTIRDGQQEMEILVFQGEGDRVEENEPLGLLHVTGLPKAPRGTVTVTVQFELTGECILEMSAKESSSGRTVRAKLGTRSTPEEIRQKLDLGPIPSHEDMERQLEIARRRSARMHDQPKGVWRWLTGVFRGVRGRA